MNKVYLLIGGNIGDRLANLNAAIDRIEAYCGKIITVSSIFETEAWGLKEQGAFLNQAIYIETKMAALELMEALLEIEIQLGRIRVTPMGPRIIDIDIIYFNDEIINKPLLTIPHPRLAERNFVLMPLVEIAPNYIHPVLKQTNTSLLKECGDSSAVYKKTAL